MRRSGNTRGHELEMKSLPRSLVKTDIWQFLPDPDLCWIRRQATVAAKETGCRVIV
jgi:hypothetical protein